MIGRCVTRVDIGMPRRPAWIVPAIVLAALVGATQVIAQGGPNTSPSSASEASAASQAPQACVLRSDGSDVELRTFALAQYAVAIDVPSSHDVSGSSGQWYVFGYLDGEPLVPDVSLYLVAGATLADAVATSFPDADVRTVERDYGGELHLLSSPGHLPDGTAYSVERYALQVDGGFLVAERYEGFDWGCFDLVARSMRTYFVR